MTKGFLPPQQQRSRETSALLIAATLTTLEKHGLDGATIPRIASAAGVAPASVYRRFRDRNALYRVALLDALERSTDQNELNEKFRQKTLKGLVHQIVQVTLQQYRSRPGLMRALTRFVESDSDEEFRTQALHCVASNFNSLAEKLIVYRDQIQHPNPRKAIMFALLTTATVAEARVLEQVSMWQELTRMTDKEFTTEAAKSFLGYLGCRR
ncbi:TetR/AcrR family transcriptional regulator [Acidicapsa ligni]|uniref:TetR/AcrR family transcriptional regulator n=1 Tax=Acidicapsa ligni TaxID=542300 RepID=UPI0021DF9B81|nr:TetR/AcrR family transcriptional regulator [Acidicapsa ligni]